MSTKKIILISDDGVQFTVDEAVAVKSKAVSNLVEDIDGITLTIPINDVSSDILRLVLEYCEKHVDDVGISDHDKEILKNWDADFVLTKDNSTIFDLILASNYMDIPSLLDLTCQRVADMIAACKTADQIREKFEIVKDFTPDEEEKIRSENQWSFQ